MMSSPLSSPAENQSAAIQATNAFFLVGLIFDIIAALAAFLTARWFQILLPEERELLQECFDERIEEQSSHSPKKLESGTRHPKPASRYIQYLSLSLFSSFVMLVTGVEFLVVGLLIYVWATQTLVVACVVSCAYLTLAPFVLGIFLIGDDRKRRVRVIESLSWWCRHSDFKE
jgi:hypothetical protein